MLSLANPQFHLYSCNKINLSHSHSQLIRSQDQQNLNLKLGLPFSSSSSISLNHNQNPFRFNTSNQMMKKGNGKSIGAVCYNSTASLLSPPNLQWVCVAAAAALMIAKGTSIQKSFLVPLFILQAPREIFNWIKGEYGIWTVFLALAVRLFYFIPKELELPLYAMLFVIASPHQVASLRGTEAGSLISLGIAGFLAFQHFTGLGGNVQKGFEQGSILATIGIIGITLAPLMLLIGTRL